MMSTKWQHPWASGPGEILLHALSLLRDDSDTNRRLAMILIDNSVELMIKTFLGLPKRITGLAISRKEYQEISESFPGLLDSLERHAADKLGGIDLGEIEWYHRLRNELYHQGNGLTVERDKVDVYSQLANVLFKNLFGFHLVEHITPKADLLGEFIEAWVLLEKRLSDLASTHSLVGTLRSPMDALRFLKQGGILPSEEVRKIETLRKVRNEIVHGAKDHRDVLTKEMVASLKDVVNKLSNQ